MDLIAIVLIVIAVAIVVSATFALLRHRQRSGTVLAAPPASTKPGGDE